MSNLSISLNEEQKQAIALAKEITSKNINLLQKYVDDETSLTQIQDYLNAISSDPASLKEIISQMQSLESWLDNVITVFKTLEINTN